MSDLASRITKPEPEAKPDSEAKAADDGATAGDAQVDGNVEHLGGSGLVEPEYEVEVKLSELQQDSSTPFYSVQTFSDLHL